MGWICAVGRGLVGLVFEAVTMGGEEGLHLQLPFEKHRRANLNDRHHPLGGWRRLLVLEGEGGMSGT